ncbi:hemerythrin domain-containing protein [Rhodoferax saidenbachensis]|uniref:Hemerythrin-like domain-containing protein n=1 Tax=Rhodoferax saidenbachensis TaxID=1484693 RepID=A0ABU1ZJU4_9BURK|nr:hemerythrin domain-containing protein [Rhodoferax saidenbachensis]MDR7305753.1 hemerythrin-like domain-containing protein [Rhodoferax saidenbachensis]
MPQNSLQTIKDEHAALRAMLQSLLLMLDRGPGDEPECFFDVLRAMLFYIDEFPEKLHHPKESDLLFPRVARLAPQTMEVIVQLEQDHAHSEAAVRELQHLLLAWELVGDSRHAAFDTAVRRYVAAYLTHMKLEETAILPVAQAVLGEADWAALDAAFATNCDPLTGKQPRDPIYDRLFTRIVMHAPAPIGVGEG